MSTPATDDILSTLREGDPLRTSRTPEELLELQLRAADERLRQQRPRIAALDHRAREASVERVEKLADLVPLLFAHSVYKTYPESFVLKGRWARLNTWLDTVAATDVAGIDVEGVPDVDGWIDRLAGAGLHVVATSGTSGKQSFLPMTDEDVAVIGEIAVRMFAYPSGIDRSVRRPVVLLAPGRARMRYSYSFAAYCAAFGDPGANTSLTDEPMLVADAIETARLRKAMADGTSTPSGVAALEEHDRRRAADSERWLRDLTRHVLAHRDRPQALIGPWATFWRLKEIAEESGETGGFHPDTVASVSGGLKGVALPADYREQLDAFLGDVARPRFYGMSELSSALPMCEQGVYHAPPWLVLLMLDESGEHLLEPGPAGTVTGRVAFYDPVWEARWGGVVSGDRATARYAACACGRSGPTIEDSVGRFAAPGAGDDKLTCGGTIEQYIRGATDR